MPGGHIELGESLEAAVVRETYEETGAFLKNIRPIAHLKLVMNAPKPDGWEQPYPEGYLLFFYADFFKFDPFPKNPETIERKFFAPNEAVHLPWINEWKSLYQLGINECTGAGIHGNGRKTYGSLENKD